MTNEVEAFLRKNLVEILHATEELCGKCPCRDVDECERCVINEVENHVIAEMRG